MHIPDGYLSPLTCLIGYAVALFFWWRGSVALRSRLNQRMVPLLALMAAFSFVIMMFNVPLPGGTTGHAVGGTLAAIVLGPWAAMVSVSIALLIQALFFGDGGLLAYGINVMNMAVIIPFLGYFIYRTISGNSVLTSTRRVVAAFIAGYLALTISSLVAGTEFGLQPLLFHAADGTPLYAPFPLSLSIPAMVIPHMAVASIIEGLATALVVAYLQRANLPILELAGGQATDITALGLRQLVPMWIGMAILVILTPLGLLASGTAWGEWGQDELAQVLGTKAIPQGISQAFGGIAPLPDYSVPGLGEVPGYVMSAVVGVLLTAILILGVGYLLSRRAAPQKS
ncbi:MAG: cobalt transporter CbiM [Chloroflexi bacterium]|nr:cobalt transporter CbiM [Chloroflexota bacterium]